MVLPRKHFGVKALTKKLYILVIKPIKKTALVTIKKPTFIVMPVSKCTQVQLKRMMEIDTLLVKT